MYSRLFFGYLAEFNKCSVNSTFPIQSIPLASYYDSEYSVAQVYKDRNRLDSVSCSSLLLKVKF